MAFVAVAAQIAKAAGFIPGDLGFLESVWAFASGLFIGKEALQQSAAKAAKTGKSIPPIAGVLCVLLLGGCAWFNENAKPVLRTVAEIARHLCLLTAEEQDAAARDGLTPAQFCEAEENLRPFVDEVLAAKQRASGKSGLTSGGEAQ